MSATDPSYDEFLAEKAEGKLVICGKCKVPLNTLTEVATGGVTFTHSQAYRTYDHHPIPTAVDPFDGGVASDCDFCGSRREMHWSYLGKNVRIDHPYLNNGEIDADTMTTNDYGERWAACKECGEAINKRDIGELMRLCRTRSTVVRRIAKQGGDAVDTLLHSFNLLWGEYLPSIYQRDYIGPHHEPTKLNPRLMPKIQIGLINFWGGSGYRSTLRREHRDTYAVPGVHTGDEDTFSVLYPPGQPVPENVWKNHLDHLQAGIGVSSLYWIAPKFTQLALMAGKDFDTLAVTREELPSPFGVMVFEDPIGEVEGMFGPARIRAASWTLVPGGVWINTYIQPEDGAPADDYDIVASRAEYGYLMPINYGGGMPFGAHTPVDDAREDGSPVFAATVLAAWFLLAQPGVAETTIAAPDKSLARAYQRNHGRPLPPVQIVDLRKQPQRHQSREIGPRGPIDYRVYRKGHWKRQAYGPKRGLRKSIYISGYIAGPDNAPLKDARPTVKVLR